MGETVTTEWNIWKEESTSKWMLQVNQSRDETGSWTNHGRGRKAKKKNWVWSNWK